MRVIPRTFLWQLSLTLIVAQIVVTVIVGSVLIERMKTVHREQTIETLSQLVPIVNAEVQEEGLNSALDEKIKKQFGDTDFRITIMNLEGVVVADSIALPAGMENHIQRAEVQLALLDVGEGWATHRSRTLGIEMMYFAKRITTASELHGIIRTAMPISRIQSEVNVVVELVLIVGSLLLFITIGTTLLVSRVVTNNINTLVRGAQRFASGDLQHRVISPNTSELKKLGYSLNTMAARLSTLLTEIESGKKEQESILQSMPSGVIALDRDKNILSFNKAAITILSVPETVDPRGRQLEEFIRDVDLSMFIENALLEDATKRFELVVLDPDGHGRELIASVQPLGDGQNELVGYLVLLDDVTTLKRLEGIRSDFSANVSHELRTPITAIKGYVETLQDTLSKDESTSQSLEVISKNTKRLEFIIEDLLSLAKLEEQEGELPSGYEQVHLSSLLTSAIAACSYEADELNVRVSIECSQDLYLEGSAQLLEQAIMNLVQNGIRYGAEGGVLEVLATRSHNLISIAVRDQGVGIPKDLQSRVFERFFRVDKGRSRNTGGTGLGLAIVKHVAMAHGGTVSLTSELGSGSTFEIQIPLKE